MTENQKGLKSKECDLKVYVSLTFLMDCFTSFLDRPWILDVGHKLKWDYKGFRSRKFLQSLMAINDEKVHGKTELETKKKGIKSAGTNQVM